MERLISSVGLEVHWLVVEGRYFQSDIHAVHYLVPEHFDQWTEEVPVELADDKLMAVLAECWDVLTAAKSEIAMSNCEQLIVRDCFH